MKFRLLAAKKVTHHWKLGLIRKKLIFWRPCFIMNLLFYARWFWFARGTVVNNFPILMKFSQHSSLLFAIWIENLFIGTDILNFSRTLKHHPTAPELSLARSLSKQPTQLLLLLWRSCHKRGSRTTESQWDETPTKIQSRPSIWLWISAHQCKNEREREGKEDRGEGLLQPFISSLGKWHKLGF